MYDIQVHKDGANIDDVPIKPGIEGGKTFEQLLEEQLKAEEERVNYIFEIFFTVTSECTHICKNT